MGRPNASITRPSRPGGVKQNAENADLPLRDEMEPFTTEKIC
jgi:hypothetical protein